MRSAATSTRPRRRPLDATNVFGVTDTTEKVWGFGIVQNFAAAATDIYVGYRHFEADITCIGGGANCGTIAAAGAANPPRGCRSRDFQTIVGGIRVAF